MFNRDTVILYFREGLYANAKMIVCELTCDLLVALVCLDTAGDHRLVRDEEERSGGNLIGKTYGKDCCCLHVNGHCPRFNQVFFEAVIILPDPPVGGINGTGPVLEVVLHDGAGDGALQLERRQRRISSGR